MVNWFITLAKSKHWCGSELIIYFQNKYENFYNPELNKAILKGKDKSYCGSNEFRSKYCPTDLYFNETDIEWPFVG
jgi:hypothetical protein